MNLSSQTTKIEDVNTEILSLLDVVHNKIDLERKLGANLLRFSSKAKVQNTSKKDTIPAQGPQKFSFDNHTAENVELSKSEKVEELKKLEEQVSQCTKCGLSQSRTNVVFGTGNPDAKLMFVGEAPGYYEDVKGEPFVGKAGQLLTKIIEAIDLKRSDVYIANILKCRPPENRNPAANEIISCTPHLTRQIDIIGPEIICALGTFAAQTLLDTTESIGSLRGRFHEYQGTKLLATYHPAYLLRNPSGKGKTWEDMKKIRDLLKQV